LVLVAIGGGFCQPVQADDAANTTPLNPPASGSLPPGMAIYGSRRFGPLYEPSRPPPSTSNGWPADWAGQPHLALDVFGMTQDLSSTYDYGYHRRGFTGYAPYGGAIGAGGMYGGPNSFGQRDPYGSYGGGWNNGSIFGSNSGFALRYGNPGAGPSLGIYSTPLVYPPYGPAYGAYPPAYGYGPYGVPPPYPGSWPGGWSGSAFPGAYPPYFYW
jgi:hypothetical protein